MKQITMREAQINLARYVTSLPIEITRFGKVVAILIEPKVEGFTAPSIKKDQETPPSPVKKEVPPHTHDEKPFRAYSKQQQVTKGYTI